MPRSQYGVPLDLYADDPELDPFAGSGISPLARPAPPAAPVPPPPLETPTTPATGRAPLSPPPLGPAPSPAGDARAPLRPSGGDRLAQLARELEDSGQRLGSVQELLDAQNADRRMGALSRGREHLRAAFAGDAPRKIDRGPGEVDQLLQRRGMEEHEAAKAATAAESDPASEASRSARELASGLHPDVVKEIGPVFERMSAAQLNKVLPHLKEIATARAAREAAKAEAERRRSEQLADRSDQRLYEEGKTASDRTYQQERDARQNAAARERAEIMATQRANADEAKAAGEAKGNFLEGYELSPEADPSKEETKGIRRAQAATRTIQETAKQIADLYRKHGAQALPTSERAVMQSLVTDLQLAMKGPEMYQLGVLAGPDMAILEGMVPNVTNAQANILDFFGGSQVLPKLNALQGQVGRRFENSARSLGYRKKMGAAPAASPAGAPRPKAPASASAPASAAGGDTVMILPPGGKTPIQVHRSKMEAAVRAGGKVVAGG